MIFPVSAQRSAIFFRRRGTATIPEVRAFLEDRGIDWPNARSDSIKDLVETRLRIRSFPTTIVVGRDGRVIDTGSDRLSGGQLIASLDALIVKKGKP